MRKWIAILVVASLAVSAVYAEAQLPRPTAQRVRAIKWRSYLSTGNIDSLSKTLTGAAAVDTTAPISLDDLSYPLTPSSTTSSSPGPRFFVYTPNTSAADTLYGGVQISPNGVNWYLPGDGTLDGSPIGSALFTPVVAGHTPQAFSAMPSTCNGNLLNSKTLTQLGLPVPYVRLIVGGSGAQAFSAARLDMSYISHQDQTGLGLPSGHWKVYSDPSHPLHWKVAGADSAARNLKTTGPDTTLAVDLSDVDWMPMGAVGSPWSNLKLSIYTTLTTAGMDSVYTTMQTSSDGLHWTDTSNGAVAAEFVTPVGSTAQWIDLASTGSTVNAANSAVNSIYLAPYARWIVRIGAGDTFPQAKLLLMYPTRHAE